MSDKEEVTEYHLRMTKAIHHGQEVPGGARCVELRKVINDIKQSIEDQLTKDHDYAMDKILPLIIDSVWKAEVTG